MEKVSSPEQLNDYIRVSTPRVWITLVATLILLAGAVIWAVFGTMQIHDRAGNIKTVAPVTFVTN